MPGSRVSVGGGVDSPPGVFWLSSHLRPLIVPGDDTPHPGASVGRLPVERARRARTRPPPGRLDRASSGTLPGILARRMGMSSHPVTAAELGGFALFHGLPAEERETLAAAARWREPADGEVLYDEGGPATTML